MYYLIAFSLLYSLRGLTSGNLVLYFLPDFILLIGIFRYSFVNEVKLYLRKLNKSANYYPYFGFLALLLLSLLRSSLPNVDAIENFNDLFTFALFNLLAYSILSGPFKVRDYFDAIFTKGTLLVITVPAILVGAMFLLSVFVSFESGTRYQSYIDNSVVLGLLGIGVKANPIPFTQGLRMSYLSLLAGGVIIMSYLATRYFDLDKLKKNLLYGSIAVSGIMVLLSDSWGPILSLLAAGGVIFYYLKFQDKKFIRIGIWVVPIVSTLLIMLITGMGSSYGEQAKKASEDTVHSSTTRRLVMWEKSSDRFFNISINHILGRGQYGNVDGRVNEAYHEAIPQKNAREIEVSRNTFFQTFFDIGIVGIGLFLFAMVMCFDNAIFLYERGYVGGLIYAGFIIYATFAGILDAIVGVYNPPFIFTLMLVLMGTIVFKGEFMRMASEDWN